MSGVPDRYNMGILGELLEAYKVTLAIAMLLGGIAMLIIGIVVGTTSVLNNSMTIADTWEIAGILGGLGVPVMIVGLFTVLPATRHQRFGAGIGLAIAICGVILFSMFFPHQWYGDEQDYTVIVASVYFLGTMLTMVYLFLSVANIQAPNEGESKPQGARQRVRQKQRRQGPNTAKELFKGALAHIKGESEQDFEEVIDIKEVARRLSSDLENRIEELNIVEEEDAIVVKRDADIPHAQFEASLPRYVELEERKRTAYHLSVDEVNWHLVNG